MNLATQFIQFLLGKMLAARPPYAARRPHLVVRRTPEPIDWAEHGPKGRRVPIYGVEYEDRSRYMPHVGGGRFPVSA